MADDLVLIGLQEGVVALLAVNTILDGVPALDGRQEPIVVLLLLEQQLLFRDVSLPFIPNHTIIAPTNKPIAK